MREFLSACYDYLGTLAILAKEIESLRAQVAELRAENAELNQILANVERHLDGVKYSGTYDVGVGELKRQRDECKADAERYRWLRDESWAGYSSGKGFPVVITQDAAMNKKVQLAEEAMDSAIDAAMREVAE